MEGDRTRSITGGLGTYYGVPSRAGKRNGYWVTTMKGLKHFASISSAFSGSSIERVSYFLTNLIVMTDRPPSHPQQCHSATWSLLDPSRSSSLLPLRISSSISPVVVGKGFKMKKDDTALTNPPTGFDSVEVGGSLNYELVIQRRRYEAILSYDVRKIVQQVSGWWISF